MKKPFKAILMTPSVMMAKPTITINAPDVEVSPLSLNNSVEDWSEKSLDGVGKTQMGLDYRLNPKRVAERMVCGRQSSKYRTRWSAYLDHLEKVNPYGRNLHLSNIIKNILRSNR